MPRIDIPTCAPVQGEYREPKKYFSLKSYSKEGETVDVKIGVDHYAEQILRGLVHSGYEVTIKEVTEEVNQNG